MLLLSVHLNMSEDTLHQAVLCIQTEIRKKIEGGRRKTGRDPVYLPIVATVF